MSDESHLLARRQTIEMQEEAQRVTLLFPEPKMCKLGTLLQDVADQLEREQNARERELGERLLADSNGSDFGDDVRAEGPMATVVSGAQTIPTSTYQRRLLLDAESRDVEIMNARSRLQF